MYISCCPLRLKGVWSYCPSIVRIVCLVCPIAVFTLQTKVTFSPEMSNVCVFLLLQNFNYVYRDAHQFRKEK